MDLEGFEPKSESESEELDSLLAAFRPLGAPGFLAAASGGGSSSFSAALGGFAAAFFLVSISTMDGWLSETQRRVRALLLLPLISCSHSQHRCCLPAWCSAPLTWKHGSPQTKQQFAEAVNNEAPEH